MQIVAGYLPGSRAAGLPKSLSEAYDVVRAMRSVELLNHARNRLEDDIRSNEQTLITTAGQSDHIGAFQEGASRLEDPTLKGLRDRLARIGLAKDEVLAAMEAVGMPEHAAPIPAETPSKRTRRGGMNRRARSARGGGEADEDRADAPSPWWQESWGAGGASSSG